MLLTEVTAFKVVFERMSNKEWYLTNDLIGIEGLPSTVRGINHKAKVENWVKRKPEGVKGRAYEYHIDSFPEEVIQHLTGKKNVASTPTTPSLSSIPYFDVYASAGSGVIPLEGDDSHYSIDIHPQILLNQGISPSRLFAMPVKGDSMEPSLYDGDIIIVKRPNYPPRMLEGVFVIRIDEQIFVKRIQFNKFASRLRIDSDNTFYDSYVIQGEDLNAVEIIGEAVFVMGRVKRVKAPASQPASKG